MVRSSPQSPAHSAARRAHHVGALSQLFSTALRNCCDLHHYVKLNIAGLTHQVTQDQQMNHYVVGRSSSVWRNAKASSVWGRG